GGCPRREPVAPVAPPPPVVAGPPVTLPDGGLRHTTRLAWMGWSAGGAFAACSRRAEDFTDAGRIGRCLVVDAPGAAATPRDAAPPDFVRDTAPPDAAPAPCRVLLD